MVASAAVKTFTILAGTYTTFINTYSFTPSTNTLGLVTQSSVLQNPSWLAVHPNNKSVVFSTNENDPGQVSSYVVAANGAVKLVDSTPSLGNEPAHLAVIRNGTEVIVPNYASGNIASHILSKDGAHFASVTKILNFTGSGPDPTGRQTSPHPHQAVEYGDEVLISDLGSDKIWRLQKTFDGSWVNTSFILQPAGSGPRHIIPYNDVIYTLHELSNTLTAQSISLSGSVAPLANISIVPTDVPKGSSYGAAELLISPPSTSFPTRYLYASNRNVSPKSSLLDPRGDSIAIFGLTPNLHLVKQVFTGLTQIRAAAIGGDNGQYLALAGQTGGGIAIYERVSGGADLKLLARYNGTGTTSVVSFAWL